MNIQTVPTPAAGLNERSDYAAARQRFHTQQRGGKIDMLRKTVFLVIAILVILPAAATGGHAEEWAPLFSIRDTNGRVFSMSDHSRKTVLLIFGTTWCPSCRAEIPHFKEIYRTYAPRGLVMVGIDIQEPVVKVARFVDRHQLPYRVLLDETGSVAAAYGVRGVPTMVLVKNGKVVTRNYREVDGTLAGLFSK